MESPRSPHLIRMVSRQSSGQQRCQIGSSAGAIEAVLRFDGANEIAAKAIASIGLIALSCLTFSLGPILIDSSLGGAISIDRDARDSRRQQSRRQRWRVLIRLVRWLMRRKIAPHDCTHYNEASPALKGPEDSSRPWHSVFLLILSFLKILAEKSGKAYLEPLELPLPCRFNAPLSDIALFLSC